MNKLSRLTLTQILNHPSGIGFKFYKLFGTKNIERVQKCNEIGLATRRKGGYRALN
jgi:hypothetical protein